MIVRTFHCDGPDCDCTADSNPDGLEPACPGLLAVKLSGDPVELHFCTWDCVLKYAAKIEPTETIPFHDPPAEEAHGAF